MILDLHGNLIVTTASGDGSIYGAGGTIFEITTDGIEKVLYTFCAQEWCTDGGDPSAGMISDSSGNVYGTTHGGGVYGYGNVFELSSKGKLKNLYSFC